MAERPLLAVVPARLGSKGVPRKVLRRVAGKPLLVHTLETVRDSGVADKLVVSTEAPEIASVARLHGFNVLDRPIDLADDIATIAQVVRHAVDALKWDGDVLVAQPTCPMLAVGTVEAFVEQWDATDWDWAIAGYKTPHLYWQDGKCLVSRVNRQALLKHPRVLWRESGALQVMTADVARHGGGVRTMFEIPEQEALDIDSFDDLFCAEKALGRRRIEFRVVASKEYGSGHLYRCLELSDALAHHDVWWSPFGLEDWAKEIVEKRGHRFSQTDYPDLVILDCLDRAEAIIPHFNSYGVKTVVFEYDGPATRIADLVFDEFAEPRYVVLRPEFLSATSSIPKPIKVVSQAGIRVLVTFGGTDPMGLNKRLGSMLGYALDAEVRVAAGPAVELSKAGVAEVLHNPIMAEQMRWADLVVTSQGRTVLEAAACGTPVVSVAVNERESRHAKIPGPLYLGLWAAISDEALIRTCERLLDRPDLRREMAETAAECVDGLGLDRVVHAIEGLLL